MAVWSALAGTTATAAIPFVDTTEQIVFTVASFLNGVECLVKPGATAADIHIMLWDASGVTPGTTAEDSVLFIPSADISRGQFMYRWTFPRISFATGCEVFVATAAQGGTASTIIADLRVFYNTYGA